jgi:hypothetical protein
MLLARQRVLCAGQVRWADWILILTEIQNRGGRFIFARGRKHQIPFSLRVFVRLIILANQVLHRFWWHLLMDLKVD